MHTCTYAYMHSYMHACMYMYIHTYIQSGVVNRGLKWWGFFSIYRPSCFIEAYSSAENYCLVCVGQLANHLWGLDLIFLSSSLLAAAE
jgi:hypothetical protein